MLKRKKNLIEKKGDLRVYLTDPQKFIICKYGSTNLRPISIFKQVTTGYASDPPILPSITM